MTVEATPTRSRARRALDHSRWISPLTVAALMLASVPLVFPGRTGEFYGFLLAYVLPPGKPVIIPAMIAAGFPTLMVATYTAIIDCTAGWFFAWNWDLTTRIPVVGPRLARVMAAGSKRLEASWVARRAGFLGLAIYVFAPIEGTGAIGGTILGRTVGMPPQRTWLAVVVGSVTSSFAWAYASHGMKTLFTHVGLEAAVAWVLVATACVVLVVQALARWRR